MNLQTSREDGLFLRQTLFDQARRVVVKVGSTVLTSENGLNTGVINQLSRDLSFLRESGRGLTILAHRQARCTRTLINPGLSSRSGSGTSMIRAVRWATICPALIVYS